MRKSEITVLSHSFDRIGGQNKVTYEVVRRLADWGVNVHLIGLSASQEITQHPNISFHKVFIPLKKPDLLEHLLLYIFSIPTLMRYKRGPLLTTGVISLYPASIIVLHFLNLPWRKIFKQLGRFHGRDYYHYLDTYIGAIMEKVLLKGPKIIAVSNSVKRDTEKEFPQKRGSIYVIYPGVDNDVFSPRYRLKDRKTLFGNDIDESDILIGYAGDLMVKRKGIHKLIMVIEGLPDNYKLILIGKGNPYRRYNIKSPLREKVIWIDFTLELEKFLANLDIFVLPSYYEPFGLVILEAMASGVPVILSHYTGFSEILRDKKDAVFLYNLEDTEEMKEKILLLAENKKLRDMMSRNGLEIAKELSWQRCAEETYKFIMKELGK